VVDDVVNVIVMAPILGRDLSWLEGVDERVRILDANHAVLRRTATGDPGASPNANAPEVSEMLARADVLLVGYPVPPNLAARAPRLKWAHHTQAGVSNLVGTDLWSSPLPLTSSRGIVGARPIAEYALAAAFYFARGLQEGSRQKAAGEFTRDGYGGITVRGATMGIIGLGGIGREVARMSRALGMRVVATRRSITAPQHDDEDVDLVLPAEGILEVAAESDFLVVCSQLTEETRAMINASVFAAMKQGSVLINVARGEEVDEEALLKALRDGRIAGAVLDVYDGELLGRPPRPELAETPEILLTPHISAGGEALFIEPLKQLFVDNLRRFLDGQPLLNVVDRERGY
jgi:glyoxylate/hydroxypyruvate reductase